ncbi:MAG TPA: hypothetical protein PK718_02805 [Candidatus Methanofastidiosa archaeon]|nr:hypothetical protein [Candidatus Methanofastidiosa archaeon]
MKEIGNKIEQDVTILMDLLGEKKMRIGDIVDRTHWSEEKTRIYLNRLVGSNTISCDEEGYYYIE